MIGLLTLTGTASAQIASPTTAFEPPVTRDALFKPVASVPAVVGAKHGGIDAIPSESNRWTIAGKLKGSAASVRFTPPTGSWDFSEYSLFRLTLTNQGPGTVWVEARLDNNGALDWANSSYSQSYLLPGETGTVTVGFPRRWDLDDSPEAYEPAAAKPNGWRSHWKQFNVADVKACRVVIRSSQPDIKLTDTKLELAWPYGNASNEKLVALPHIDRFGQAIPFDWPTKIHHEKDLQTQRLAERAKLDAAPGPAVFNAFGGYANGPHHSATGYFRTEKINGKWWLVDPAGKLFWSHGVCTVGNRAVTPIAGERKQLFAQLPEPGTPDRATSIVQRKDGPYIDFVQLNSARKYGNNWKQQVDDLTHRRLRAWGMNTLGAWSDKPLIDSQRTPYTEILHVWAGPKDIDKSADPYEPGFEKRYRDAVAKLAETRREDPWMLGVFIDNEIHWHNNMIERVLERGTDQPAYNKFIQVLKAKHGNLEALNKAWGTNATNWDALTPGTTPAWQADREALYAMMADRYYRVCKQAVDDLLPNHLYLGSRVHTAPVVVIKQMAKHVDVYSANHYAPLAGTAGLPRDADVPVIISEFHFGTVDRGVTGMSLCPVDGQTQRARNYAAYVTAGLIHPNVVGTHWFAYTDQSTVGRPNENYQIGMIDITDTPYDTFTAMTRAVGERMYAIRLNKEAVLLEEVQAVIHAAE